ncbi:Aste57867_10985 [Aphanomyces stellatus]|uniref:Aste57867_10985 protein n=1 Tax=Aphanomyces stellatus TaxID=120398 RepID=A0A485KSG4_9STRA|nr:hypothetical protein As57867_010944 [Aphanomyces stellatus]VFT87853.1 Aste57867_10985 [Aphanomyces stellatus]
MSKENVHQNDRLRRCVLISSFDDIAFGFAVAVAQDEILGHVEVCKIDLYAVSQSLSRFVSGKSGYGMSALANTFCKTQILFMMSVAPTKNAAAALPHRTSAPRILRVKLNKATDLAAADYRIPGLLQGKSDPYVVFRVGDQKFKSTCISSTLNPVWGHELFEFTLTEAVMFTQALVVEVYDHDLYKSDDLIGTTVVALAQFELEKDLQEVEWELDVPDEFANQAVHSVLHATVEVLTGVEKEAQVVEAMVEVQAWGVFSKWTRQSMDRTLTPVIPPGFESAMGWVVTLHPFHGPEVDDDVDMDGWLYAHSMAGPWYKTSKNHLTAVYRKREWTRSFTKVRAVATQTKKEDATIEAILQRYGMTSRRESNQGGGIGGE